MSLLLLCAVVIAVLVAGYLLYGSFIARQYRLDDSATTPAVTKADGVDFVPTRPFYLMSQHFSAIAAAGPIVGPIAACLAFGWLPALLWIIVGVVLIGAVHDFSALVASVRHGAHSVADIAKQHLGKRAYLALVAFIWIALLYVILAFTAVTADTFKGVSEDLAGARGTFNKGGAVAAASAMYLVLALVMGLCQRYLKAPVWLLTLIFVPATLGCVWLGTSVGQSWNLPVNAWYAILLGYCLVASMLPMWLLQQPRGYLGGFVLYIAIAVGLAGVLAGGFTIEYPAVKDPGSLRLDQMMFPFLFVTIACGACSGFHGLICGGTTSRQIAKESHCRPIGFGAMLLEGLVAVIALATVMILTSQAAAKAGAPAQIYGDGLASFFVALVTGGARAQEGSALWLFAATFGAMAFSTFVFDTLDVSTRLGRYLLQELFQTPGKVAGVLAAAATAGVPLGVLLLAEPGSWRQFWTLFGTSNQLLAALTLLGVTVWLYKSGKRVWYVFLPMLFVMAVTLTALGIQIWLGVRAGMEGAWRMAPPVVGGGAAPSGGGGGGGGGGGRLNPVIVNATVATALLGLALAFIVQGVRAAARVRRERAAVPPASRVS